MAVLTNIEKLITHQKKEKLIDSWLGSHLLKIKMFRTKISTNPNTAETFYSINSFHSKYADKVHAPGTWKFFEIEEWPDAADLG